MLATHDQFTQQMCDRLKTTEIGLGLVRLLQDARRFEEARATLYSLEGDSQSVAEKSVEPKRKPCKAHVTRTAASARIDVSEMPTQPLCLA